MNLMLRKHRKGDSKFLESILFGAEAIRHSRTQELHDETPY